MSEWKQNLIDFNMALPEKDIKDTEKRISHIMKKSMKTSNSIGDIITFQRVNPMIGSDGMSTTKIENLQAHHPMLKCKQGRLSRGLVKTLKKPVIDSQAVKIPKWKQAASERARAEIQSNKERKRKKAKTIDFELKSSF